MFGGATKTKRKTVRRTKKRKTTRGGSTSLSVSKVVNSSQLVNGTTPKSVFVKAQAAEKNARTEKQPSRWTGIQKKAAIIAVTTVMAIVLFYLYKKDKLPLDLVKKKMSAAIAKVSKYIPDSIKNALAPVFKKAAEWLNKMYKAGGTFGAGVAIPFKKLYSLCKTPAMWLVGKIMGGASGAKAIVVGLLVAMKKLMRRNGQAAAPAPSGSPASNAGSSSTFQTGKS